MNNRILYIPKEKKNFYAPKSAIRLWMVVTIAITVAAIAGSIFTVRMSAFQIHTISVSGTNSVSVENIQKETESVIDGSYGFGLVPYRFLLAVPAQKIADRMRESFPLVADITVKKVFPDELDIAIRERELFGILCNDRAVKNESLAKDEAFECSYLDTEGIAYQRSPVSSGFLITRISTDASSTPVGAQAIERATMDRMIFLRKELPAIIGSSVTTFEFMFAIPHEIRAVAGAGFSLIFKRDDDFENVLRVLKAVLEKEIGSKRKRLDYIDLRYGNKVFYKYK